MMKLSDLPPRLVDEMEGLTPSPDFESNGITIAPNRLGSIDFRPAGHFHDWGYSIGGNEAHRAWRDRMFRANLRTCMAEWVSRGRNPVARFARRLCTRVIAGAEYRRVRLWGIRHFNYERPPRGLARVALYVWCFFARYWT